VQVEVVDSFAMLAFYNKEVSAVMVRKQIETAQNAEVTLVMSAINAGEVYYILAKRKSMSDAMMWKEQLMPSLPIRTDVPTLDDILDAAHLKSQYPISYADAFAASLALRHDAPLMTGDPDFRCVPNLRLNWIGS